MKIITKNRKLAFDYEISETRSVGIVLAWHEVKSCKTWHINISNAFCKIKNQELYIHNMDIPLYDKTNVKIVPWYDPFHNRKLLMTKREIAKIYTLTDKTAMNLFPVDIYIDSRWIIKLTIWLCKIRRKVDKKELIKDRDVTRQIRQDIKNFNLAK